jgi:hypothetical protein
MHPFGIYHGGNGSKKEAASNAYNFYWGIGGGKVISRSNVDLITYAPIY